MLALVSGCAARATPPALPSAPKYPEFLFPAVPPTLQSAPAAARIDRGWRFLQSGDLSNADREFAAALKEAPGFYPAQAGAGYVSLARGDHAAAVDRFGVALGVESRYLPALVGRGQALLALHRDDEALAAFESALAVDSSLADVRQRADLLKFRGLQATVDNARAAAAAGDADKARAAYARALDASPQSAFLHRELAAVERKAGNAVAALDHLRRATELDPFDAGSLIQTGELLEQQGDAEAAEAAYRRALAIEPSPDVSRRLERLAAAVREARLPPQFKTIPMAAQITRGDLAALIGIRLESLLRDAPTRQVVITDVRGHWAAPWINRVAATDVMTPFENHTFQPGAVVRRVDLARAVSALVSRIADQRKDLAAVLSDRPVIADVTPNHLDYPAVAVAVSSGMMPRLDEQRFRLNDPVPGAEATEVIERLQALASGGR